MHTAGRSRQAIRLAALLLCGGAALLAGGCGGSSGPAAAQHLQREDLVAVSRQLDRVRRIVAGEVAATKAAWPTVANGLPAASSPAAGRLIDTAIARSLALELPVLFQERQSASLTGPAAEIGGLYRGYAGLAGRGWQMIGAALGRARGGDTSGARFARANAALYIESVYDAHYGLAQIGRKLLAGYEALGGAQGFGSSLSASEVRALAEAYSEASARLHPHAGVRLGS